jgi:UDP-N-acetylmuramoyl-L-alanyl-D-glutamate--2,6-diaminopimelate ligase
MFSELISKSKEIVNLNVLDDFRINKLCYDTRKLKPGDIFFAVKGLKTDGNKFIDDAISKGVSAIFTESDDFHGNPIVYKVNDVRKTMASLSSIYYNFPSHRLRMIGVTGTNGKTTVSTLIYFILKSSGIKTGLIGTNGNYIGGKFLQTEFTTPESIELNELLSRMGEQYTEYAVLEVSSHSLDLNRVYGLQFDLAVFMNLTPEHLDFHLNMENYCLAKKKLFDSLTGINLKNFRTKAIYNSDDEYAQKIISQTQAEKISFGFHNADYAAQNLSMNFNGMKFELTYRENNSDFLIPFSTRLTGRFNVYNILASIAVLKSLEIPMEKIKKHVEEFKEVEGRFAKYKLRNNATAIVDYSHTPDSLKNALMTIREILDASSSKGRIITVFGCGGDRDKSKRSVMGKIAESFSDFVFVTSDNPRSENPDSIISEILLGMERNKQKVIIDRERAITEAIETSGKEDVILIAGKGHENYQIIGEMKLPFSDKEIVQRYTK